MADSYGTLSDVKRPLISFRSGSASPPESSSSGAGHEEQILAAIRSDTYVVDWFSHDDKGNPQNLPYLRKWLITMSLALYALTTTFASSVFGAATHVMAEEFELPNETIVFGCTSLFMVGFAAGPPLWG